MLTVNFVGQARSVLAFLNLLYFAPRALSIIICPCSRD